MITFRQKGDFKKINSFLQKAKSVNHSSILDKYGKEGVAALMSATPKRTGLTASSWSYEIIRENGKTTLAFNNSNVQNGVPIAIILQYGHATSNGGWVEGIDYIEPTLRPIFEKIKDEAWKEVTKR